MCGEVADRTHYVQVVSDMLGNLAGFNYLFNLVVEIGVLHARFFPENHLHTTPAKGRACLGAERKNRKRLGVVLTIWIVDLRRDSPASSKWIREKPPVGTPSCALLKVDYALMAFRTTLMLEIPRQLRSHFPTAHGVHGLRVDDELRTERLGDSHPAMRAAHSDNDITPFENIALA
jgi:hypothetical protein